jgi:hypothetical protein
MGTICAETDLTTDSVATQLIDAPISNANPVRIPTANRLAIRSSGFLCNASSYLAIGHFIVLSPKGDMVFP